MVRDKGSKGMDRCPLTDYVAFCLKLFSNSTADAVWEGCAKHTAQDGKSQQNAVLARHIFTEEPG
jgi:hypothetical protein